jgi:TRAP-type transport system large permease protein
VTALALAFAFLILIGVPIAFALGLAGVAGMLATGLNLITVPTRMFTGIDSFVLLAAPFYILAGDLMNRGGITDRLIRLAQLVVGRIAGGTAYANIVASVFFAGISGTAIADTAALGQIFIRGMEKEGYKREFAAAVTVASSVIGPIIPPSVIMVIFAAVSQVSVIQLFLAGIVPGLMLGGACAVVVWLYARAGHLPVSAVSVRRHEVPRLALDGVLVATLPAIIVLGTLSGAFTAT